MQDSAIPAKLPVVWASAPDAGTIRVVPTAPPAQVGAASLQKGFPLATTVPIAAGGSWPFCQDFNGILNVLSAWAQWNQAGGPMVYDAAFSTAIGGYPKGATLYAAAGGFSWISAVDNNVTNPDAAGAGWMKDGPYVSQGGGNLQGTNTIHMGWDGTNGLVRVQVDSTDMGGIAFQSWVSSHFLALTGGTVSGALTVTGAVQINSNINVNGTISTLSNISSGGNINSSGQFSSQLGLNTSGGIACGVTVNPDPVGSGLPGIVIAPQGTIDCFSNGCEWGTGSATLHNFFSGHAVFVGGISTNGSSTTYATTSDYRLKVNIIYLVGALDRIASVPVHRFGFIDGLTSDPNQTITMVDGWLAHELAVAVPEAVVGEKDGVSTHANVVLSSSGKVFAEGVSEADWEAGKLAIASVDPVTAVAAQAAMPATATTPAIPAVEAVEAVAGVIGRPALYAADTTWQASVTVPVYQQVDQSKTTPVMWAGLQEAYALIKAQADTIVAMQAQITEILGKAPAA